MSSMVPSDDDDQQGPIELLATPPRATDRLPQHHVGTWAEMLAMAWLLGRGYEVFLGVGATSCDLVALTGRGARRIEVKKASRTRRSASTGIQYAIAKADPNKFDDLLVVLPDGTAMLNPTSEQVYGAPRRP